MIDLARVGNKIADLRGKNAMSQDQLAARLYVSRQAISAWEKGKSAPSIDNVIELSKIFHVSFEEILCLDDTPTFKSDDPFEGHDRHFVITEVIDGRLHPKMEDFLYHCTGEERLCLLKAIRSGRIPCRWESLRKQLTAEEFALLEKGEDHNED